MGKTFINICVIVCTGHGILRVSYTLGQLQVVVASKSAVLGMETLYSVKNSDEANLGYTR